MDRDISYVLNQLLCYMLLLAFIYLFGMFLIPLKLIDLLMNWNPRVMPERLVLSEEKKRSARP